MVTRDPQKTVVSIYGQNYTLLGAADTDYMMRLARFVDEKMKEIADVNAAFDPLKVAILSAVNIANELFRLQEKVSEQDRLIQEKSEALLDILDKTLNP